MDCTGEGSRTIAEPSGSMSVPPAAPAAHAHRMSSPILSIHDLGKTYGSGLDALKSVDLEIRRGEIFALLGPNGAGKTTLISIVCGIVTPSTGTVTVAGHDILRDYRAARGCIGLVPQELSTDSFETVMATVRFSRGLFGKPRDDAYLESVLRELSLWDKRDSRIMTLSGGMKRRVLIAKALSHQPELLFLDEPTAGVDVQLRHDMWQMVHRLREQGTTIILTTHYIEEAEQMADRIGVINKGQLKLVEDKDVLMRQLGRRELQIALQTPLQELPGALAQLPLELAEDGSSLVYRYDAQREDTGIAGLLRLLQDSGIEFKDLHSHQSSLEDIFVDLLRKDAREAQA